MSSTISLSYAYYVNIPLRVKKKNIARIAPAGRVTSQEIPIFKTTRKSNTQTTGQADPRNRAYQNVGRGYRHTGA